MARPKSPSPVLKTRDLGRWRLLADFQERLAAVSQEVPPESIHRTFADPRRKLQMGQYLSLFLLGLLNPVVRTMRALCAASDLDRMQRDICGGPVSLGSFSETQDVIDPALLEKVFAGLVDQVRRPETPAEKSRLSPTDHRWLIVDSTLWEALPRMHWALWRNQGTSQTAVRLHLGLHLLEDHPVTAHVTTGRGCERKAWKEKWQSGDAYVGDRYYGEDYRLFGELDALGCAFVLRLRNQAVINVLEELPLTGADHKAGIVRSAWATLGCKTRYLSQRVRLVWIRPAAPDLEELILVTNQPPEALSAELVGELYRRRWQVELFFRWIKCILGNRHWLAESERGVTLQIYLALIAALLLQLHTGARPSKRMLERIQLHLMGLATVEELLAGVQKESERLARRATKKP